MTKDELIEEYLKKESWRIDGGKRLYWTRNSSIISGRPVSDAGGDRCKIFDSKEEIIQHIDADLFTDLPEEAQRICEAFYRKILRKSRIYNHRYTSYGLKHQVQYFTNIYMTNNQFKDFMLREGFLPYKVEELNWDFQIDNHYIQHQLKEMEANK